MKSNQDASNPVDVYVRQNMKGSEQTHLDQFCVFCRASEK
jgi:hypothetical protein